MTVERERSLIEIGRVVRPHGVRGELKIVLHWEGSDALDRASEAFLAVHGGDVRKFEIRRARPANRAVLVTLVGIDDRDAAETLRGASVSVSRDALAPLDAGEYYLSDLVGATVVSPDGVVGEVVEVRVHPSVDTLVVKAPDGALLEQPLVAPWIVSVDTEAKRVELSGREGLISS